MEKCKVYVEVKESEFNAEFEGVEFKDDEPHYGNGIWINILRNGKRWQTIDFRYIKYVGLKEAVTAFLKGYFGENLVSITEIDG